MNIEKLQGRKETQKSKKINKAYDKLQNLIEELERKDLPSSEITSINKHILMLNSFKGTDRQLLKTLKKTYSSIISSLVENVNLIPIHHFRAKGILYGSVAGLMISNIITSFSIADWAGSMGVLLCVLTGIGIIVGNYLDNNAKIEGRQLEVEAVGS